MKVSRLAKFLIFSYRNYYRKNWKFCGHYREAWTSFKHRPKALTLYLVLSRLLYLSQPLVSVCVSIFSFLNSGQIGIFVYWFEYVSANLLKFGYWFSDSDIQFQNHLFGFWLAYSALYFYFFSAYFFEISFLKDKKNRMLCIQLEYYSAEIFTFKFINKRVEK